MGPPFRWDRSGLNFPCVKGHRGRWVPSSDRRIGSDMTATVTVGEGAACVFVAVDHCTAE